MKINIVRGQNQIGGSIIKIETAAAAIYLDIGINLEEGSSIQVPQVDGLFCGTKACDGVFISHYHSDHIGLLPYLLPDIPVYMGEKAYQIFKASASYRGSYSEFFPHFLRDQKPVAVGDMVVTPLVCDHSAYDSYMFLIEADGKTVLYTGDFRANGRMDFDSLIRKLPHVDAIITEGTALSRDTQIRNIEEEKLEEIAVNFLKSHHGPAFIVLSATNIDRLTTIQNVARRTGRLLLEDVYTAQIASAAKMDTLAPGRENNIRVFTTGGEKQYEKLKQYGNAKIGKREIADSAFIMCVRQSMLHYLQKLNDILPFDDGVLFYAMWKGYMEQTGMQDFLSFLESKGVKTHILHTSGHADGITLDKMIDTVDPEIIIPVHTENAGWFNRYAGRCNIVLDTQIICI